MLGFSRKLMKIKMQLSASKLEMPWIPSRTPEVHAKFKLSFSKSGEARLYMCVAVNAWESQEVEGWGNGRDGSCII